MMKRSASATPSSSPISSSPSPQNDTPSKKRKSPKSAGTAGKVRSDGPAPCNGTWTPEAREGIIERILDTGYKTMDLGALAQEYGLSRQQLKNQLSPGRKGNFRDKAIKAVRGEVTTTAAATAKVKGEEST
ncbi:hypothetical protein EHS25_008059 [Saitozyma podzolica]|uniref:Uncharacterized protein n=1 Tax=Saitozyma podzolica TaxID=1890683 RepID=A0A427YND1_9TREE|nr:hypothetical protein EHS25_008059 [Saitozyma podzolica]